MFYITGDTHNTIDMTNVSTGNMKLCCAEQGVKYEDITSLIILGDFGLPWNECPVDEEGIHPLDKSDKYLLDWYNKKPFPVFAVMGNHDNYDMLKKLPEVQMFGSTVLKVSENIFYLKRGEVYIMDRKKILVLGGARSDDMAYRKIHESWWPEEEWGEEEKQNCLKNIQNHGCHFDYVLSHTGPSSGIALADPFYENPENLNMLYDDSNVVFNDLIDSMISYNKWFFGHWHSDYGYENYAKNKYVPLYRMGIGVGMGC